MSLGLGPRVARAFRVRGAGARRAYVEARRLARFFRDADRRSLLQSLPPVSLSIPPHTGFLIVDSGQWPEVQEIVADARRIAAGIEQTPTGAKGRKRFLQNVLERSALTLGSPLMRFALREDVLRIVSEYLGVIPLLSTVSVLFSDTVDRDYYSSQLYHCDGDDVTQVKIFIHCTDVDPVSGPLTVLDAEASGRVLRGTGYRFDQRLTDEQAHAFVGEDHARAITGPAGTTAFVDTSRCLHYGSRVLPESKPRLVAMIQYQTPYSFMPPERTHPFQHLANDTLSELQRLALGG